MTINKDRLHEKFQRFGSVGLLVSTTEAGRINELNLAERRAKVQLLQRNGIDVDIVESQHKGNVLGAYDYLLKPFEKKILALQKKEARESKKKSRMQTESLRPTQRGQKKADELIARWKAAAQKSGRRGI